MRNFFLIYLHKVNSLLHTHTHKHPPPTTHTPPSSGLAGGGTEVRKGPGLAGS